MTCRARQRQPRSWSPPRLVVAALEGPLIRPFGAPSPQGEKGLAARLVLNKGPALWRLSPSGRGREAVTYDRGLLASLGCALDGAVVSHLAEPVRGNLFIFQVNSRSNLS